MPVFRFVVRAQPTSNNPKYSTWQPADFIGLISASDRFAAEAEFLAFVLRLHWKIIQWKVRDQLIEERVQEVGGEIWEGYKKAVNRGKWYKIVPEHFMPDVFARSPMVPPRPDEAFVDRLIFRAGGRRPTIAERAFDEELNADYILDNFIIELKDMQEERLEKSECHEKLAELFWPYFEEDAVVPIDWRVLNDEDWNKYVDIFAVPIKKRIAKAAQQINASIARQKIIGWKGGIILLNSGFASLEHGIFELIATHTARAHKNIDLVVCISSKAGTNGFDWCSNWEFSPKPPLTGTVQRIFEAYDQELSDVMNNWAGTGFHTEQNHQILVEPISFHHGGKIFTWDPGCVPFSFEKAI